MLECLVRRIYDPDKLLADHPPKLAHPYKRLVFDVAVPRMDVVAVDLASAESRADLLATEVTGYRASTRNALEAQDLEEVSRESCCHRSWRTGIADLHSPAGRNHRR